MDKRTLVLGASENPSRYSNIAIRRLRKYGHSVIALGKKKGKVEDVEIQEDISDNPDIDTVTMYLNPFNQKKYYQQIIKWNPKRIIFNPGAENRELEKMAEENGIETENACTLVLLSTGGY